MDNFAAHLSSWFIRLNGSDVKANEFDWRKNKKACSQMKQRYVGIRMLSISNFFIVPLLHWLFLCLYFLQSNIKFTAWLREASNSKIYKLDPRRRWERRDCTRTFFPLFLGFMQWSGWHMSSPHAGRTPVIVHGMVAISVGDCTERASGVGCIGDGYLLVSISWK